MRLLALSLLLLTAAAVPVIPAWAATPAAPFLLDEAPRCDEAAPDVAFLPGGGFVAVWGGSHPEALLASSAVYLRRFDRGGRPLGPETRLTGNTELPGRPAVAAEASGTILVVWGDYAVGGGSLQGRLLGPTGNPLGDRFEIAPRFPQGGVDVTAETGNGFAVVWAEGGAVLLQRYTTTGVRGPEEVVISYAGVPEDPPSEIRDPVVVAHGTGLAIAYAETHRLSWADPAPRAGHLGLLFWRQGEDLLFPEVGSFVLDPQSDRQRLPRPSLAVGAAGRVFITWREQTPEGFVLRGRIYTALAEPLGPAFRADVGVWYELSGPSVAADAAGNFLVAWLGELAAPQPEGARAYLRRFGPDGALSGGQEPVSAPFAAFEPATSPALAVDAAGRTLVAWGSGQQLPPGAGAPPVCFNEGLFARLLDPVIPLELPLQGGRFLAGVRWTDHAGHTGVGRPVPLTGDSGYFWFFDHDNAELVVKVLDGRAFNGHFWVFYGALTDVAYVLEVKDTLTGAVKTYTNPAGRLTSRADTAAFAVPGPASVTAVIAVIAPATELAFLASSEASPGTSFPAGPFCVEYTPPSNGLCLGGRFDVAVEWRANGTTGLGRGATLGGDSGYFWFFGPNNVELLVKVLDGRPLNGRFWVFSGALTDVEHWLYVRDSVTGEERIYHNPPGRLASLADTAAF
jgi:hypothetical protein